MDHKDRTKNRSRTANSAMHLHARQQPLRRAGLHQPNSPLHSLRLVQVQARQVVGLPPCELYDGAELRHQPHQRRGADDHAQCPSRMGSKRFYRDGRVESIGCNEGATP